MPTDRDDPRDNPTGPGGQDPEPERLSWAAYFGAAAGLILGLVLSMLGAAGLYALRPDSDWAEVFWQVASPLLAILGALAGGFGCHRWMRGQIALPAILFFTALVVAVWLAFGPIGFPWKGQPA